MPKVENDQDFPRYNVTLPDGRTANACLVETIFVEPGYDNPERRFYVETDPEAVRQWHKLLLRNYRRLRKQYRRHSAIPKTLRDKHRTVNRTVLIRLEVVPRKRPA